jgi:hypothetical protein
MRFKPLVHDEQTTQHKYGQGKIKICSVLLLRYLVRSQRFKIFVFDVEKS